MIQDATIVGLPIPGMAVPGVVTSEDDWVVTGSHRGKQFRKYVTPNVDRDGAIHTVAMVLRLTPDGLEWITAHRRAEVERCIRLGDDWLRSRTV